MQKVSITIGNKKHFTDLDAFSQHIGKIGFFFCLFDRQRVTQHDKDYELPYLGVGGWRRALDTIQISFHC